MFKLKSAWNIAVGDEIRIPGGKTIMKISRIEYEGDRVFHIFCEDVATFSIMRAKSL